MFYIFILGFLNKPTGLSFEMEELRLVFRAVDLGVFIVGVVLPLVIEVFRAFEFYCFCFISVVKGIRGFTEG